MSVLTRVGVIAGALALSAAGISPAHAARYGHTDAASDVTQTTCDANGENCTDAPAGSQADPDIRRTVVTHGARRVSVYAKFAELNSDGVIRGHVATIKTNEGMSRDVTILRFDGQNLGTIMSRPNGDRVRCRGLSGTVDVAANTVNISIPRYCLSRPRWIRAGFGSFMATEAPEDGGRYDESFVNGPSASDALALSPRIRRG